MKIKNVTLCVYLLSALTVTSQNPVWIVFNTSNSDLPAHGLYLQRINQAMQLSK